MIYLLGDAAVRRGRDRRRGPRDPRRRPRDVARGLRRRTARACSPASAASCASPPASRSPTSAAAAGTLDGQLATVDARIDAGVFRSDHYPDVLGRAWDALACPTSGEILLSAAPGLRVLRLGRRSPRRRRQPRLAPRERLARPADLHGPRRRPVDREQWSIKDVAPLVLGHFGLRPTPRRARPGGIHRRPRPVPGSAA